MDTTTQSVAKPHAYRLKYDLKTEVGRHTKEELKAGGHGGTDSLLFASMLHPEDGSYSQNFWSVDGRNGGKELSSMDLFKFWMLMGKTLSQKTDLDAVRKAIAFRAWDSFWEVMK